MLHLYHPKLRNGMSVYGDGAKGAIENCKKSKILVLENQKNQN